MSGGLDHALDVLTPEDFASAADGFRYLRLDHVAGLVSDALSGAREDGLLEALDARYNELIPRDAVIDDQLGILLTERPADFAPAS